MKKKFLLTKIFAFMLLLSFVLGSISQTRAYAKSSLNKTELTLLQGASYNLKLSNASGNITWKSSKSYIAYVTNTGEITGLTTGSCTITATSGGSKYECKVKVKANDVSEYMDLEWKNDDNSMSNGVNQNPSHIFGYTLTKAPSWHKKQDVTVKKNKNEGYESVQAGLYPGDTVTYEDYTYDGKAIKFDVVSMQIEYKMQEESWKTSTWDYVKKKYGNDEYVPPYSLLAVTYHLVSHEVLDYTSANLSKLKLSYNGKKVDPSAFDKYSNNLKKSHERNDKDSSAHAYTGSVLKQSEMGVLDRSEIKTSKTFSPNLIKYTLVDEYDLKKKPSALAKKAGIPVDNSGYATSILVWNGKKNDKGTSSDTTYLSYNPSKNTFKKVSATAKTGLVISVDISTYVNVTDNFKFDKYYNDLNPPSPNNVYLDKKTVKGGGDNWARLYMNDQVPYWKHYAAFVSFDKFVSPY